MPNENKGNDKDQNKKMPQQQQGVQSPGGSGKGFDEDNEVTQRNPRQGTGSQTSDEDMDTDKEIEPDLDENDRSTPEMDKPIKR